MMNLMKLKASFAVCQTLDQFRRHSVAKLKHDWDRSKSELLEVLGVSSVLEAKEAERTPSLTSMDFASSTAASPAVPLAIRSGRTSHSGVAGKMAAYGKVVEELNRRRKEKAALLVMQEFHEIARTIDYTDSVRHTVVSSLSPNRSLSTSSPSIANVYVFFPAAKRSWRLLGPSGQNDG